MKPVPLNEILKDHAIFFALIFFCVRQNFLRLHHMLANIIQKVIVRLTQFLIISPNTGYIH
jgi:hypothetical protein